MDAILPLNQMTIAEKMRTMEALWADLSRRAENFESPAWHANVLRDRDRRLAEGQEAYVSWEDAKRELRGRLS